jgi:deazaflavin-dependent oxidoreductase (nitroreductase family)
MNAGKLKRGYLWLLKNTLNRVTARAALSSHGPFSLVRHIGRKTGKAYQTPLILARLGRDFIAELTYGEDVSWYRNAVAAHGCTIVWKGEEHRIVSIEPCDRDVALRAFGYPAAAILRLLRRREFRLLRAA